MSDHSAFRAAAEGARKQADRQGLSINWMRWDEERRTIDWTGISKKAAKMALADGQEITFEPRGKRSAIRGLEIQGELL